MSRACGSSAQDMCQHILPVSRRNNSLLDVTGVLVCTPQHFVQALEGPDAVVDLLFDKIVKDARHQDIRIIKQRQLPHRQFGAWAMAHDDRTSNAMLSKATDALLADTDAAALL